MVLRLGYGIQATPKGKAARHEVYGAAQTNAETRTSAGHFVKDEPVDTGKPAEPSTSEEAFAIAELQLRLLRQQLSYPPIRSL